MVDDLQETFPPPGLRRVAPRHPEAWARLAGGWQPVTVIQWLWGEHECVALVRLPDSAERTYHYDDGALVPRLSEIPPDQWRWNCTRGQADQLWPMRRYRPWPPCPGCGAAVDSVSYADAAHTALIVLPCGQRLDVLDSAER